MNDRAGSALVSVEIPSLMMNEAELCSVLESSVYPGAALPSIKLVVGYCKAQRLDPMTKPVHIVPMRVKQKKRDRQGNELAATEYVWRDVIMPGIELYRTKAARTQEYAGIASAVWGADITETLGGDDKTAWDDAANAKVKKGSYDKLEFTYPEWCELTVLRIVQGKERAFTSGRVYWKETYATQSAETSLPNEMWKKRKRGQLEKCAEALALRRAFPEIGGDPTREEMEGKVIDSPGVVIDQATGEITNKPRTGVEMPVARGEQSSPPEGASNPAADPPTAAASASTDGAGSFTDDPSKPRLSPTQLRILKKRLEESALSELDFKAKFGGDLASFPAARFNEVADWLKNPAA